MTIKELLERSNEPNKLRELENRLEKTLSDEDIKEILIFDERTLDEFEDIAFNEKEQGIRIIRQLNKFIIRMLSEIINSNKPINDSQKRMYEIYMMHYFRDGINIDCNNSDGRKLITLIEKLDNYSEKEKEFFQGIYSLKIKDYKEEILALINEVKNKESFTKEEIIEYDKTFGVFLNIEAGTNHEKEMVAEIMLDLIRKNDDKGIEEMTSLDILSSKFRETNREIQNYVFSILLDYEEILRSRGIKKNLTFSPIKFMKRKIDNNTFGIDKEDGEYFIRKGEMSFVLKVIENPNIVDNSTVNQIKKILSNNHEVMSFLEERDIKKLILGGNEIIEKIGQISSKLQENILTYIDSYIERMLINIMIGYLNSNIITQEQKDIYSKYMENYLDRCIDRNYDNLRMTALFMLMKVERNNSSVKNNLPQETIEFLKNEFTNNQVSDKYKKKLELLVDKMLSDEEITPEDFKTYDKIFEEIYYEYYIYTDSQLVKAIKGLDKRSKQFNLKSFAIETIIKNVINEEYEIYFLMEDNAEEFQKAILVYYQNQLQQSAKEINDNSAISHLIRIAQMHGSNKFLDTLEQRNKNKQIPDMKDYDFKIQNNIDLSQEEWEEFVENICEIRLQQGIMPQKYSYYIVKQTIISQIDTFKYQNIIERALEDLTENELNEAGIYNYEVRIVEQKMVDNDSKYTMGTCNTSTHTIKLAQIIPITQTDILEMLDTIGHECTHAEISEKFELRNNGCKRIFNVKRKCNSKTK